MFKGETRRVVSIFLWFGCAAFFLSVVTLTGCKSRALTEVAPNQGYPSENNFMQPGAEDGQWPMAAKDYANTRFSGLDQINGSNVANLKVSWTFSTGVDRGQEAAPIVIGDTMYVVTPYPNHLYALDLKNNGAIKWEYDPAPEAASQGVACCDVVNRGAAFANGKVFINTLDGNTCAVDAATGKEIWKTKLGDINKGETITMSPLAVKDKVYVGNSGGEFGVRGWITALNADDGHIVWKAFNTGPDADVLIGPNFHPFYDMDKGQNLGVKTWPPDQWKLGGSNVWGFISYDPETNLIFHGTGNPGVWNPEQRPGDNKWSNGIFARNADTGEAAWYYQFSPHDQFDHDGINENILITLPVNGQPRKVVLRPDRNGYMYVLDRGTGQVLSATPYVYINSQTGVDLQTGRLGYAADKMAATGKVVHDICPNASGAKDWEPSAYSPRTGLLYVPHENMCMDWEGLEANYIAGTPYVGVDAKFYAGPGGNMGLFTAWDPVHNGPAWQLKEKYPVFSGALVTAGDVVFYGTLEGWFKAVDAKTGNLLWQFKTGSGIIGQPVTYRGPDGKQYIAILSGIGGWPGAIVAGDLDTDDQTTAAGWGKAMEDLKKDTTKGGTLYVFALP